ncbi:MAG: sugar ABC transporter permease [Paracoccus sp. (in: a-proteobacteria)]|nr:sugar ABC transporter permease [Paracoccus sp. (in: a-proteobacteria)]
MTGGVAQIITAPLRWLAGLIGVPLRLWQRLTGQGGMIALFLLPNMAIFTIFVLVPLGMNIAYSTTGGVEFFLADRPDIGLAHYARLLDCDNHLRPRSCRDDMFWIAVWNTARFVLFQVGLMVLAAMITALILNRAIPAKAFWRAMFFFPVLLSPVVVGLIWKWILQRQGLANLGMVELGLEPVNWLTDRFWSFAAAVGVSVWAHMGFYTLILLAGLQAIPRDLYEAAEMDGTSRARTFWRITLPLLMPNLLVVLVLALIRAVQIFDEAYVLTGGGPGTSTMFITQYIYEVGFANLLRNPGLAAAASILMAGVLVVLTLVQLWLSQRAGGKR